MEKICNRCGEVKPLEAFNRSTYNKVDGRQGMCRDCNTAYQRARRLARPHANIEARHRLPPGSYERLRRKQRDRCAICGCATPRPSGGVWHTDHDHKTKRVRGLLCLACNQALGRLGDDIESIERVLAYLREPPASFLYASP